MNHTPGPWYAARQTESIDHGWAVIAQDGDSITGWGSVTTSPANARLIATAPELLETLKAIRPTLYGMLCDLWGHPNDWPQERQGAMVYQKLVAAIAKTTEQA